MQSKDLRERLIAALRERDNIQVKFDQLRQKTAAAAASSTPANKTPKATKNPLSTKKTSSKQTQTTIASVRRRSRHTGYASSDDDNNEDDESSIYSAREAAMAERETLTTEIERLKKELQRTEQDMHLARAEAQRERQMQTALTAELGTALDRESELVKAIDSAREETKTVVGEIFASGGDALVGRFSDLKEKAVLLEHLVRSMMNVLVERRHVWTRSVLESPERESSRVTVDENRRIKELESRVAEIEKQHADDIAAELEVKREGDFGVSFLPP